MGAFMISFSPVFVSLVNVSPTTSGFYRVFFGGVALTTFIFLSGRRLSFNKSIWIALLFSAVFFTADLWFWHRSILYVGPGLSTLLANFQVFFMLLASIMLFKQQPTKMQIIAIPIALLGLLAIVGIDWNQLHSDYRLGVIFGLLTAVSYTGYMLFMRQAQIDSKHVLPVREIAIMSLLVALSLGVIAQVEGESLAINSLQDLSLLLAYGLFSHATGLILIASALAKVTTAEVGIVLLLQPSLSFIWDVLLFNRSFTLVEFIGVSMVLIAIYMSSKRTE
ncbi:MAG: permease [Woeseiaceae bacterium]|jgi:drug/metabolite transporter (DMT)-like permease|nr:permease [Woeseiaceae bacterium]|tara:strand:- start:412 stop:1248 length:837 start_codon:yes stop_codon:yes gene_type:complete